MTGTAARDPVRGRLAEDLARTVRGAGGTMFAAGRWRWGITGPRGTIIIGSRKAWPHRKLRNRIRAATGVALPASREESKP